MADSGPIADLPLANRSDISIRPTQNEYERREVPAVYRTVNRVNGLGCLNFLGRRMLLDTYNEITVVGALADAGLVLQNFLKPLDSLSDVTHGQSSMSGNSCNQTLR